MKKFRAGGVPAAIWENEAKINGWTVTMLKATIERRYKDKNGEWKSSSSFGLGELPQAITALDMAMRYVSDKEATVSG